MYDRDQATRPGANPGGGDLGHAELVDTDGHQELGGWLGGTGSFSSRDGALSPVRLAARSGVKSTDGKGGDGGKRGSGFLGQ